MKFEETEEWKKYEVELKEKEKTLLWGDDVIHLTYLAPLLDNEAIKELKANLKVVSLRLSSYDEFGLIKASFEDYSLQVYLLISNPITLDLLKNIGLNTIWETIKYSALKVHKKIFNTTDSKKNELSKKINFGVKLKVDDKLTYEFKLDGDLSDELILKTMDKTLDFIKSNSAPLFQSSIYSTLDRNKNEWRKINVMEEVKKKVKKNKK